MKIETITNLETLKTFIKEYNENLLNGKKEVIDLKKVDEKIEVINENFKNDFSLAFVLSIEDNRKIAFQNLMKNPNFDRISIAKQENGTYVINEKKALFRFSDLERKFQEYHSTETKTKNGKNVVVPNKSKTIFGALRFYGVCDCFIRNLFIENLFIDSLHCYDLTKVVIEDKNIFTEKDGECFSSTSNNALEKQLNVLVKFFDIEAKMLKKDLPILKLSAQKIKKDVKTNKASIHEIDTLKFVDTLFSVITSRVNNENVKVFTNDGNEVKSIVEKPIEEKPTTEEVKTENTTEEKAQ